jgi:hypothetical protein
MTARLILILALLIAVCLLLGAGQALQVAQASDPPGIGWWVLSPGGGPASGEAITLNATLGQPVVGQSSAGSTLLKAGYWAAAPEGEAMIYLPVLRK